MNTHPLKKILLILIISTIHSTAFCSVKKVYSIDGRTLTNWMATHGYKSVAQASTPDLSCSINNNILSITPKNNHYPGNSPSCLFSLFKGSSLKEKWKVQALEVISNGRGKWYYKLSPKGKASLETIIYSEYRKKNTMASHTIKIVKIILTGPFSSSSWKQAFNGIDNK